MRPGAVLRRTQDGERSRTVREPPLHRIERTRRRHGLVPDAGVRRRTYSTAPLVANNLTKATEDGFGLGSGLPGFIRAVQFLEDD